MSDGDKAVDEELMQDVSGDEAEHETVDDGEVGRLEMRVMAMPDERSVHEDYVAALRRALGRASARAAPSLHAQLRKAREDMAARWPQGYDFWEDWLVDEFGRADQRDAAARARLRRLCAAAFAQTHAVDVLLLECDLVARCDTRAAAVAAFEAAVACAGCHVAEGTKLWEAYRAFVAAPRTDGDNETRDPAAQRDETLALFRRELALPLAGMDRTFASFTAWAEGVALDDAACRSVEELFDGASRALAARAEHEAAVGRAGHSTAAAAAWERYIAWEQAQTPLAPERVASLYERALAACGPAPEAPRLWAAYSAFVAAHMPQCTRLVDTQSPLCVFVRGVWHCTSSSSSSSSSADPHVVLALLHDCEHEGRDGDTAAVAALMLGAMGAMATPEHALELANGVLDWHVRKYRACGRDADSAAAGRARLVAAADRLCEALGALFGRRRRGDAVVAVVEHVAKVQYAVLGDAAAGRRLYERVVAAFPGTAAKWLKYAELERYCCGGADGVAAARALHRRALAAVSLDGVQAVIASWVELERLHGSLDEFRAAWQACCTRLYAIQQQQQQQQQQQEKQQERQQQEEKEKEAQKADKRKREAAPDDAAGAKEEPRKRMRLDVGSDGTLVAGTEAAAAEGAAGTAGAARPTLQERLARSVHVTGLPRTTTQEEVHRFFAPFGDIVAVRLGRTRGGTLRGFGFVEFAERAAAERAIAQHTGTLGGRALTIERCEERARDGATAQLFVSNLDFAVTEDELRALFAPRAVAVLKIHRGPDGRSKGFGFVKFAAAADAEDALRTLNRTLVRGRELKLQPFHDGSRTKPSAADPAPAPPKAAPLTFAAPRSVALKRRQ